MNWIVVADSSNEALQDAGHILCKQKMRVTGFKSGQGLLEFLKDNRPDLILLGSVLWDIGGFDAISTLKRARKTDKEIPVLLMAEQKDPDLEARAQAMGAAGILFATFAFGDKKRYFSVWLYCRNLHEQNGGMGKSKS